MAYTYLFAAYFTKAKIKTTPVNAPTVDICDLAAPTGSALVSGGSPTQLTNLTGYYVYSYTTSTLTTKPVANFYTADTTVDSQDVGCYPQAVFDSNGLILGSVNGYASGQDPATLLLATPANKLATASDGSVALAPAQQLSQHNGTATAGATTTLTLAAGASATDNLYRGNVLVIVAGTGANQARVIKSYVGSTKVATLGRAWAITPDNTSVYTIFALAAPLVNDLLEVEASSVQGNVTGSVASVSGAVGSVAGNVGGNVVGSVASVTAPVTAGTVSDKTGYALTAGEHTAIATDTQTGLTAQGYNSTRAGYLANLNVGGLVASSAEAVAIQNNTRAVRVVPDVLERPDIASTAFRLELLLYDEIGNMEAPDSAPTLAVVNQAGSSRDANLDSTTMTLVSTGRYRSTYTVDTTHAVEELVFTFSVIEGGATRLYGNAAQVVDTTAVDFTTTDRTTLQGLATTLAAIQGGGWSTETLAAIYALIGTRLATTGYTAPDNSSITAIKAKTDNLPTDPTSAATVAAEIAAIPAAPTVAAIRAEMDTNSVKLDATVGSRMATFVYTAPDNAGIAAIPPAAAVAAAVWADATATTLLAAIAAIRAADDPLANPVPGHYSRGTAGAVLGAIVTERGLTVVSPVLASGAIEIYRDGSYQDAYNSGIAIPIPDSSLDLTDAVLHFVVEASGSGARLDVSSADPPPNRIVLSSPTGTGRVAAVQLATATTATAHSAAYTLWAYPPGGAERLPLAQGRFTVVAVPRAPLP